MSKRSPKKIKPIDNTERILDRLNSIERRLSIIEDRFNMNYHEFEQPRQNSSSTRRTGVLTPIEIAMLKRLLEDVSRPIDIRTQVTRLKTGKGNPFK